MTTYIVGDIHGCFREWIRFKSKIESLDTEAEFILVGDILDKGANSFEMLQWAREKIYPGSRYQMVLGNHEEEKIRWLQQVLLCPKKELWKDREVAGKWLSSDGMEFFRSCLEKHWGEVQLRELYQWLAMLPIFMEKEADTLGEKRKYVIAHSRQQLENAGIEILQQEPDCILVHGHQPTTLEPCKSKGAIPGKIWIREKDINVDCGLVYGVAKEKGLYGDLAALRLQDCQEFYYYNHKI